MKRRDFMTWVGLGCLATSLPVAIAACRTSDTADAPTGGGEVAGGLRADGFTSVATVAELDAAGVVTSTSFLGGGLAVVRNPADETQLLAVNPTCPHANCTAAWDGTQTEFVCPCHGSRFSPEGAVVQGPAATPLSTYEVKVEGDQVLVKAG
jgi:cytochrome b6-f complex iron-sulfur subunit